MARPTILLVLALLTASLGLAQTTCPSQGALLLVDGGRLGDLLTITVAGAANAPAVLAVDVGGGPIVAPPWQICLDLSPALFFLPLQLDGNGIAGFTVTVPPAGIPDGFELFLQGAELTPALNGVTALTNGERLLFRAPRFFFLDPGYVSPFGGAPGAFYPFNAVSGIFEAPAPASTNAVGFARVASQRWLAILTSGGTLTIQDEITGAVLQTANVSGPGGSASDLAVLPGDSALLVSFPGVPASPFNPTPTPGSLVTLSLPNLVPFPTAMLTSGNPTRVIAPEGSPFVYLVSGSSLIPVDPFTGTALPAVQMGPASGGAITDWAIDSGRLITLLGGNSPTPFGGGTPAGLNGVDLATVTALLPSPSLLPINGPATILRRGPGTLGTSLFAAAGATLVEVNPATLATANVVSAIGPVRAMELSNFSTEWLLLQSGTVSLFGPPTAGTLRRMDPATLGVTTVTVLPQEAQDQILVVRSDTLAQAYVLSGNTRLVPFTTDPVAPAGPNILLPQPATSLRILGDR